MATKKPTGIEGVGIPRRVRNNHGSMLVTIPPDIAAAAGITFQDYVLVRWSKRAGNIILNKVK